MTMYTIKFALREAPHEVGTPAESYYPVLADPTVVTSEQLFADISHATTLTPADVTACLTALRDTMIHYLAQGKRVDLQGIGTFAPTLKSDIPIHSSDDKQVARHLSVGGIIYRPKKAFMNEFSYIKFHRPRKHTSQTGKLTDEQILHCLHRYLSITNNKLLTTSTISTATGYSYSRTYRELPGLVERGLLTKMGTSRFPYYILAPDSQEVPNVPSEAIISPESTTPSDPTERPFPITTESPKQR